MLFISIVNWWYSTFRMQLRSYSFIRWKGDKKLKQVIQPDSKKSQGSYSARKKIPRSSEVWTGWFCSEAQWTSEESPKKKKVRSAQTSAVLSPAHSTVAECHLLPLCCGWSDEGHTPLLGTGKRVLRLLWGTEVAEWCKAFPSPSLLQGHCTSWV